MLTAVSEEALLNYSFYLFSVVAKYFCHRTDTYHLNRCIESYSLCQCIDIYLLFPLDNLSRLCRGINSTCSFRILIKRPNYRDFIWYLCR